MFLKRLGRRAQSTAEYAIVFALVVAAVIAMQTYVKRGLQGRVKDAVDHTEGAIFTGAQYEPYYMSSDFDPTRKVTGGHHEVTEGYGVTDEFEEEKTTRTGYQEFLAPAEED